MNVSEILRSLLDVIAQGQSETDSTEQTTEITPVEVTTTELPIDIAQQEFDSEEDCCPGEDCSCNDESDFPELDVIKRNAGMMPMVISTDGPSSTM